MCACSGFLDVSMRSPAGLEEEATDKRMDGQTDDKWLSKDWEQSQAKRDVGSGSGWLSVNSSERQRMKVTTVKSKRGVIRRKERMSGGKGKRGCTFVYGGSSHVVETQGCVHVVHVLQESKEILHLLKCDALHNMGKKKRRLKKSVTNQEQIIPAVFT